MSSRTPKAAGAPQNAPWNALLSEARADERLVHETSANARPGRPAPIPADLHPLVLAALERAGVDHLYAHQAQAIDAAFAGPTIVTTGTASGKSLCFQLPTLEMLVEDRKARALYIYPTKALAQDQARALNAFGLTRAIRPAIYDGDTPRRERPAIRRRSNVVITNPDMLHVGILPHHAQWGELFANLAFVVIDEAHVYRGVFGSHVARVLRRLRRIAALYGTSPRFLLASATIANPVALAQGLTGLERIALVDQDHAPRSARRVAIWNPPLLDQKLGTRASPLGEAAEILAGLVSAGARTICFMKSRKGVELIMRIARDRLEPELAGRVAPYRAGYTPRQRHEIEARLHSGELLGVVATDALELGIDIGKLDAAVCVTFPGTVAGLRQMWGRAGRRGCGLAVFIAGEDALDQFFARHPAQLLRRPVEAAIIDPDSPEIRAQHLLCAAHEAPITAEDAEYLGADVLDVAAQLTATGALVERARGFVPRYADDYPAARVGLRSASADSFALVDASSGEIFGTVEAQRAYRTVHDGAVYLHFGRAYLVAELDIDNRRAILEPFDGDYFTQPKSESMIYIERRREQRVSHGVTLSYGQIVYSETVLGYQRKRIQDQSVVDFVGLELPTTEFATMALWYELDGIIPGPGPLAGARTQPYPHAPEPHPHAPEPHPHAPDPHAPEPHPHAPEPFPPEHLLGALHALEHGQIAVLPLIAMCDRWDIGGLSTNAHPQTGVPTIFIYDGLPGGIGLTRRGYEAFDRLVADASRLIGECPCERGCPSCVQSPKCGNLNEPLSKAGALELLRRMREAEDLRGA